MKLRYFYKIDHKREPIPGSNVRRKSKPKPLSQWKEILDPCCSPVDVDCTCGPRFFVQLDGLKKPVDHSLIKRFVFPRMDDGIKYYELPWKSDCCSEVFWTFVDSADSDGSSLVISETGVDRVTATLNGSSGSFSPKPGSLIEITLTNGCLDVPNQSLTVLADGVIIFTSTVDGTYSFVFDPGV